MRWRKTCGVGVSAPYPFHDFALGEARRIIEPCRNQWRYGALRHMAIRKLEYYEGAALFRLIRSLGEVRIRSDDGAMVIEEQIRVYFKYSTRTRTPWSFTFSGAERHAFAVHSAKMPVLIGLVCGSDGIAALEYSDLLEIAGDGELRAGISCSRRYDEHYTISGPVRELGRKIAPSAWNKILLIRR